ncbi:MAG: hypothetical protein JSU67_04540, partial [Gammaproteobacteria bacterium]
RQVAVQVLMYFRDFIGVEIGHRHSLLHLDDNFECLVHLPATRLDGVKRFLPLAPGRNIPPVPGSVARVHSPA